MAAKKDQDRISEMQSRYEKAQEGCTERYDAAADDIRFVTIPGSQWDSRLRARRGDRPTYEFPKLGSHIRLVVNEMRQARPQGKVRGVEESDVGLAEIIQGLGRNIEDVSNADIAYLNAYQQAVKGGLGWIALDTDYAKPDDFDLDILICPVRNFACVKVDPSAVKIDRSDMMFAFEEDTLSVDEYKRQFPDSDITGFFTDNQSVDWRTDNKVRIARYWWKSPKNRTLWALSNGDTVCRDEVKDQFNWIDQSEVSAEPEEILAANGLSVVKEREVKDHEVMCALTNGYEFLTDPYKFPSRHIPLVPVWGDIENIDGDDYWQGMVRPSKDQQRLINVFGTAQVEAVAKAPKTPFILKQSWIKGFEKLWANANAEDRPYLPVTDAADGIPQRVQGPEIPTAMIQLSQIASNDMKDTTGIYNASLGQQSNELSGVAINSRKQQGSVATFHYIDNLSHAIRRVWEIMIDMIPKVYDTNRVVRILGADGATEWKELYQEVTDPITRQKVVLNDISKGKYDVTVTIGPSYATQRMEAVEVFSQLAAQIGGAYPAIGPLLSYVILNNVDMPGAEEVSEALRNALVKQGLLPPKEGDQPPAPPAPDPRVMAEVEEIMARAGKHQADAAAATAKAQTTVPTAMADNEKTIAEAVQKHIENLIAQGHLQVVQNAARTTQAMADHMDATNQAMGAGLVSGNLLPTRVSRNELSQIDPSQFNGSF
jgi:hypothetical protein